MKPKILLIGDDIRLPGGVSNICKNIILNTIDKFDWIQLASRPSHPEHGIVVDISKSVSKHTKVDDCYARLYCNSGYGDEQTLFNIIESEKIDAVLHMTDPRFYTWLYSIENKVRDKCPLCYYHVWDNYPIPMYNKSIYQSCDWIGCISELTYHIVCEVTDGKVPCTYVPHGVDCDTFKKLPSSHSQNSRLGLLETGCDFAILSNNLNMRRKQLPSLIESYDKFCKLLTDKEASKTVLMLHTSQTGEGGHDLVDMVDKLYPDRNVLFSTSKVDEKTLNQMYNTFSITANIASNEGFGLATLESLATETPIICNKTGGLSSQITDDNTWGIGIEPAVQKLSGDKHTPYLYEDFVATDDVARAFVSMYTKTQDELLAMGIAGRAHVSENYSQSKMIDGISAGLISAMSTHTPPPRLRIVKL